MGKLSRILVPIDFSPVCDRALAQAAAIASRSGAELHVLHVQVLSRSKYGWAAIPVIVDVEKVIADLSRKDLDKAVQHIQPPVISELVQGLDEAPTILEYCRQHDIDLIVMGSQTRNDIGRMFLGSVTAEVLRESPVSVLVIGPEHPLHAEGYRQVLAPVDFSESSVSALQQASVMARAQDANLVVLHVVEPPKSVPYISMRGPVEAWRERAAESLDKLVDSAGLPQAATQSLVLIGRADREIVRCANEQGADLIVMGTEGLSGLSRMLLGSTTERVLRSAPCAVLAHRGAMVDSL